MIIRYLIVKRLEFDFYVAQDHSKSFGLTVRAPGQPPKFPCTFTCDYHLSCRVLANVMSETSVTTDAETY